MKKYNSTLLSVVFMLFFLSSCDEDGVGGMMNDNQNASNSETANALKEALQVGTDTAVSTLAVSNGYFMDQAVKILLPEEIQDASQSLKDESVSIPTGIVGNITITGEQLYNGYQNENLGINFGSLAAIEDDLILGINRAAEEAANTAKPIFSDAITGMTISDANDILFGTDTAATFYLKNNTSNQLFNNYEPKMDEALNTVQVSGNSVVELYEEYVSTYNEIVNTSAFGVSFGDQMGLNAIGATDLSAYATNKALDGLFLKVGEEEKNIRENPIARVTELLEKVFSKLDEE